MQPGGRLRVAAHPAKEPAGLRFFRGHTMGRIRTIKPEFFNHEELYDLEHLEKLPLRLAFVGLWTICDREGRFKWRPRSIKAQIMPYDNIDFSRVLDALASRGFVVKYASEGVEYGYVPGFLRHQVINNRESPSTLPAPEKANELPGYAHVFDASFTRAERDSHASCGEGKGKEMERKEFIGEPPKEKRKRFTPPTLEEVRAFCTANGLTWSPQRFIDHYAAGGWKLSGGRPMADWQAAARNWKDYGATPYQPPPKPEPPRKMLTPIPRNV